MKKFLSSVLMIFIFAAVNIVSAQSTWKNSNKVSANFAQEVLELVNIERAKEHLKPLKLSSSMNHYAQIRAKEITKKFSHTRPSGYSCFTVIPKPYRTVGENIAAGQRSPSEVVAAWMNSPGHRENIMNPKFRELGMGYLYLPDSKYKHYWAQLFRTK
ncbi:MAG: CAP domain-containing protein [Selenomonadaceae bacterium]|nr:CAP domain-containing protein [Selenomonadaceae bacterium]